MQYLKCELKHYSDNLVVEVEHIENSRASEIIEDLKGIIGNLKDFIVLNDLRLEVL